MERIFPETFKYAGPALRENMNAHWTWLHEQQQVHDKEAQMHRLFDCLLEKAKTGSHSPANPWNACHPCGSYAAANLTGWNPNGSVDHATVCPWNGCQPCGSAHVYAQKRFH